MANKVQMNASRAQFKFVEHTIVPDAQFEFRTALQPLV